MTSRCLVVTLFCVSVLLGRTEAWGCLYSSYALSVTDNTQTNLQDLLFDRFAEKEKERGGKSFYARELDKLQKQYPQRKNDPQFLTDYGFLLHTMGNTRQAIEVWQQGLALEPRNYALLCNLATVYHTMGQFREARDLLLKATKLKPGFRHRAEEYHLQLLDHLEKQREDGSYIKRVLFLPELTSAWRARKDPPNRFVPTVTDDMVLGLAELLRQFPRQADVWLVLAMMLESQHKWREAGLAYQRALRYGCGVSEELADYYKKYAAFAEKKNPVRYVGWMFASLFVIMVTLLVAPRILNTIRAVVDDIQEYRRRHSGTDSSRRPEHPTRKTKRS